jgi:hypothetical protein
MSPRLATATVPLLALALACAAGDAEAPAQELGPHDGHDLPGVALERVQVGDTAPDFSLESYDDGVVTLSDFRGDQNVVLAFYRGHW